MATDAQGRQLSDDGNYYWDGAEWQLVSPNAAEGGDASTSSQQSQGAGNDAQGRQLSPDGNYYWDGAAWQLVQQGVAAQGADTDAQGAGVAAQDAGAGSPSAEDLQRAMNVQLSSEIGAVAE
jgi:hypothetical protein